VAASVRTTGRGECARALPPRKRKIIENAPGYY
jgi:hypothetical protein